MEELKDLEGDMVEKTKNRGVCLLVYAKKVSRMKQNLWGISNFHLSTADIYQSHNPYAY